MLTKMNGFSSNSFHTNQGLFICSLLDNVNLWSQRKGLKGQFINHPFIPLMEPHVPEHYNRPDLQSILELKRG